MARIFANNLSNKKIKLLFSIFAFVSNFFAISLTYLCFSQLTASNSDAIYELISRDSLESINRRSHIDMKKSGSFSWEEVFGFYKLSNQHKHPSKEYTFLSTYSVTTIDKAGNNFNIAFNDAKYPASSLLLPSVAYYSEEYEDDNWRYLMFDQIDLFRYKKISRDWSTATNKDGYSFCYLSYPIADSIIEKNGYASYDDLIGRNVNITNDNGLSVELTIVNIIVEKGCANQIIEMNGNFFVSFNKQIFNSGYSKIATEFRSSTINIREYFNQCYLPFWETDINLNSYKMNNLSIIFNDSINRINNLIPLMLSNQAFVNIELFILFLIIALFFYGCFAIFYWLFFVRLKPRLMDETISLPTYYIHAIFPMTPLVLIHLILSIITSRHFYSYQGLSLFNFYGSSFTSTFAFAALIICVIYVIKALNMKKREEISTL